VILALARHILEHGIDGRFYSQVRKYHHEDGMVYWIMSPTAEGAILINRCRGPDLRGAVGGGKASGPLRPLGDKR
jgi:hypothetical protein